MDRWKVSDGRDKASALTLEWYDDIERKLAQYTEQRPEILEISFNTTGEAYRIVYSIVQLFPGCEVEIGFGYSEDVYEFVEDGTFNYFGAVYNVIDWIERFREIGYDQIQALLHELRWRIRTRTIEWRKSGFSVYFSSLRFEVSEDDFLFDYMPFVFGAKCLGQSLMPENLFFEVNHPDNLETKLDDLETILRRPAKKRNYLDSLGADGFIDQMTLNILQVHGDPIQDIRTVCDGSCLSRGRAQIYREEVEIRAKGHFSDPVYVDFAHDHLWIDQMALPEVMLQGCQGKPITSLVDMPYLSEDIHILSAEHCNRNNWNGLRIDLKQSKFLYCADSGRFWRHDDEQ